MAYSAKPADIPLLRRKTANVVAKAGLGQGGHAAKALNNILDNYPRDELFQTNESDLLRTAVAILHLGDRQRFRLFVRRDLFDRFVACLIYAPRENYTTELREKWQAILLQAFNGTSSEFNVHLSESALARVQVTVRTTPGKIPAYDVRALEARLARRPAAGTTTCAPRWSGPWAKRAATRCFGSSPVRCRRPIATMSTRAAVPDIEMMACLSNERPLGMALYRAPDAEPARCASSSSTWAAL
jgi:glutamate dehydrogenase